MSVWFNEGKAVMVFSTVGALIRHSFYFIGALVLGFVGIYVLPSWQPQAAHKPKPPVTSTVAPNPPFRLASSELGSLHMTARAISTATDWRIEALQYGRLFDRDRDLTVALMMPPPGSMPAQELPEELGRLRRLNLFTAGVWMTSKYYDLETRFGALRASEMQVDVDGQRKLCLAYVSRFDTPAAYLSGWSCDADGARPVAADLACTLDRLTLSATLPSPEADAFFRKAQGRAPECSAAPVTQTTDTRNYVPRRWR